MANYGQAWVKLTNTPLKKLEFLAKKILEQHEEELRKSFNMKNFFINYFYLKLKLKLKLGILLPIICL